MPMPIESKSVSEVEALMMDLYNQEMPLVKRGEAWPFSGGPDTEEISKRAVTIFGGLVHLPKMEDTKMLSAATFEEDLVNNWLPYFSAPEGAGGVTTTGGTESILFAVHAALDKARRAGKDTRGAEIIAADTAWIALEKAARIFQLDIKRVPLNDNLQMDVEKAREAVTDRTVLIFASAPSFHYATLDDIEGLGAVAKENDIWLHVDACSGGMLVPFLRRAGRDIPPCDFAAEGVSSLSADSHKFGYSYPGCSLLFFRDQQDLENAQFDDLGPPIMEPAPYTGLTGTKPVGPVAAAWAVMQLLGDKGYEAIAAKISKGIDTICEGVSKIDGVHIYNDPKHSLLGFQLEDPGKMMEVFGHLAFAGWVGVPIMKPEGAFNMFVSYGQADKVDQFLEKLKFALEQ